MHAFGIGAIAIKLLDIFWLQRIIQEHQFKTWLRDKRLESFSRLTKEFVSFGLHQQRISNPFEQFAVVYEVILLIEDDLLTDRMD